MTLESKDGVTYTVNFLNPMEKAIVLSDEFFGRLLVLETIVHVVVSFVRPDHRFSNRGNSTATRGGGQSTSHRAISLANLLQTSRVLVLRAEATK